MVIDWYQVFVVFVDLFGDLALWGLRGAAVALGVICVARLLDVRFLRW